MRLECKKSRQSTGENASGSSTNLRQKAVPCADRTPPAQSVGVDAGPQVRVSLTVVSGARNVEEHLGGVLIVRAPRESITSFPSTISVALASSAAAAVAGTAMGFGREVGYQLGPRLLLAS